MIDALLAELEHASLTTRRVLARVPLAMTAVWRGASERANGELVSGNYFDVLGVQAAAGRTFAPGEDTIPGAHPVVVLSDRLWRRRFNADTAVVNGNTYFYTVSAVNTYGESAQSAYAGATPNCTIPATPTGLAATPGDNQVSLSWTTSSGATSYNVKRSTTSGGPYTIIAGLTSAAFTDTTAVNGTTYYYVVSAVGSCGESANSAQVSATPSAPAGPPAPTGLTATPVGKKKINLSWTASAGATSYTVKRALATGGPYTAIATGVTATTYSNTGLTTGTTYYYVISAVNTSGESPNSSEASATAR